MLQLKFSGRVKFNEQWVHGYAPYMICHILLGLGSCVGLFVNDLLCFFFFVFFIPSFPLFLFLFYSICDLHYLLEKVTHFDCSFTYLPLYYKTYPKKVKLFSDIFLFKRMRE